jgi:Flp pilus assembly protein TadG
MVKATHSRQGQRGNVMVLVALITPVLVGLVGLAVDGTMCYIVQTELSAAVDGAALGTGRLLSTNANPTNIAGEFLDANFRVGGAGFWGSYSLTPTINVTTGITKTVTITAQVDVPLLFMRIFGQNAATVAATGTATRRDARIELVIDRSGSMNNSDGAGSTVIKDLVSYAQGFVKGFTPGYDEMGLVVFSGSGVVGYPTTPWPAPQTYNGGGGPDVNFCGTSAPYVCGSSSTDMYSQIGKVTANNGTGMGDALALAYIELQKAHMRDLAKDGADTRMNVIVLFTDGVPSAVDTYLNQNGHSVIKAGSGCTYATDAATPTRPMYGYVVVSGSPPYSSQSTYDFYQLASLDTANSSSWYMNQPAYDMTASPPGESGEQATIIPSAGYAGCNQGNWGSQGNLNAVPSFDKYGYPLTPSTDAGVNGYMLSSITGDSSATSTYESSQGGFSPSGKQTSAYQWGLAGWDEVDNVAYQIRSDANYKNRAGDTSPMAITIMTVGYTGNGGTDWGLLTKIANVSGCKINGYSCYNNTQQAGLYVQASNTTQLANAMSTILSAILRLSH